MNATTFGSSDCTDDRTFHVVHRCLDVSFHWAGVFLNVVLLYLVNNHSGSNVGPYKNVFRLTCVSDLTISFFAMIGQKVILVNNGDLVFLSNSILSRRWPLLDFFAVFGVTGNHFMNTVFLPIQYIYRYLSLCRRAPTITVAGYVVVVVSEVLLVKKLEAVGVTTDMRARQMQAQFKRALTALAVCPLIFVFIPVSYFVVTGMFEMKCSLFSTIVTMLTSSIALANPHVTIVTVRPYRVKVTQWFSTMTGKRFFNAVTDTSLVTGFQTDSLPKKKSNF